MEQGLSAGRDPLEQILVAISLLQQLQKRALSLDSGGDDTAHFAGLANAQEAIQTGTLAPELALFRIADLAIELVPAQGAGVWLFAGDSLVYRAGAGTASNDERLRNAVLSKLLDVEHSSFPPLDAEGPPAVGSLLVAPIYQGPRIAGALAVFSENANCFSPSDLTKLRLLTGLLAQAVDKDANARLRHQVSLERAVVLNVIGAVVPSLTGLVESRPSKRGRVSRIAVPENEIVCDPSLRGIEGPAVSVEKTLAADASGKLEDPEPAFKADATLNSFEDSPELIQEDIQETLLALEAALVSNPNHIVLPKTPERVSAAQTAPDQVVPDQVAPVEQSGSVPLDVGFGRAPQIVTSQITAQPIEHLAVNSAKAAETGAPSVEPQIALASGSPKSGGAVSSENQLSRDRYFRLAQKWFLAVDADVTHRFEYRRYRTNWNRYRRQVQTWCIAVCADVAHRLEYRGLRMKLRFDSAALVAIGTRIGAAIALLAILFFLIPTVHVPKDQTTGETPAITAVHRSQVKANDSVSGGSHMRVTDSAAASAVRDLSRFEIPGLLRRAQYGDDSAAFTLGMAYETGHGVPQDCAKATHWVSEAASGGDAAAQYNLSLRYRDGDGVPPNAEESEKWRQKAAAKRYLQAQTIPGPPTSSRNVAALSQP
jgi:hypothetical protein